jgi:hypothetical protein
MCFLHSIVFKCLLSVSFHIKLNLEDRSRFNKLHNFYFVFYIQTDWGGEYHKLHNFFQTTGIHHRLSCPHTHKQNSTVKRRHQHIVEIGLTLLGQCNAP